MFDAVIRGMVAPPDKVAYTNTINNVLCISDTFTLMFGGKFFGQNCAYSTVSKDDEKFQ